MKCGDDHSLKKLLGRKESATPNVASARVQDMRQVIRGGSMPEEQERRLARKKTACMACNDSYNGEDQSPPR